LTLTAPVDSGGDIRLVGTGDVRVGRLTASGLVEVVSGGDIGGVGAGLAEFFAAHLIVTADGNIDAFTTAGRLSATATGAGEVRVTAANEVLVDVFETHGGTLDLTSGGAMTLSRVDAGMTGEVVLRALAGGITQLADSGGQVTPVIAETLRLFAAGDVSLSTSVTGLYALIEAGGSLDLSSDRDLSAIDIRVDTGSVDLEAPSLTLQSVRAEGTVRLTATAGAIGQSLVSGEPSSVSAEHLILTATAGIELTTDIRQLTATVESAGAGLSGNPADSETLRVTNVRGLEVLAVAVDQGSISIEADGNLRILGDVTTAEGNLHLESTAGDVRFVNSDLQRTLQVDALGDGSRIDVFSTGTIEIDGDGKVLFRANATTQQNTSQYLGIRPELRARAASVEGLGNIQIDAEGKVLLFVSFGSPEEVREQFFRLTIDWGDGVTQTITSALSLAGPRPLIRGAQADGEVIYAIPHQYLSSPDVANATGQIPIVVVASNARAGGAAPDISFFAAGNRVDPLVTRVDVQLNLPINWQPPAPPIVVREVRREVELMVADTSSEQPSTRGGDHSPPAYDRPLLEFSAVGESQRYYELRIVLLVDEFGRTRELEGDIRIDEEMLGRLPELFSRLPDDRYRIYEIREDGVSQLVTDVVIRGGKAVERMSVDSNEEEQDDKNSGTEPPEVSSGDDESGSNPLGEPLGGGIRGAMWLTNRGIWLSDRRLDHPVVVPDGGAKETPGIQLPLAYALRSIRSGS
jgi:hypothetical protein